jgi:hypothetical protein
MKIRSLFGVLAAGWAASILFAAASCAQLPPAASYAMAPAPGQARIWFYRELAPYSSQGEPYIRLNGAPVGVSQPGGAFYRDVPPGHYHITADSYLDDPSQDRDVNLVAGQEIYAKIVSSDYCVQGGGGRKGGGGYGRDTFYVWLYPAEAARPAIAQSAFYGGGAVAPGRPPG